MTNRLRPYIPGALDRRTLAWGMTVGNEFYGSEPGANPTTGGSSLGGQTVTSFDISSRLKSIKFKAEEGKKTSIEMVLYNEDLAYFEVPVLMKGQEFFLTFGYPGAMISEITAKISNIKGFKQIKIISEAVDLFNFEQRNSIWKASLPSDIITIMAKRYGFVKTVIEPTFSIFDLGDWSQLNQTDYEFCNMLADLCGFKFYISVENKIPTLHFHRRNHSAPPLDIFTWRGGNGDLKNFDITENSILGTPQTVTTSGYDVRNRQPITNETNALTTSKKQPLVRPVKL